MCIVCGHLKGDFDAAAIQSHKAFGSNIRRHDLLKKKAQQSGN